MKQIEQIVTAVYTGSVSHPEDVARYVTRRACKVVVMELPGGRSILVTLEPGVPPHRQISLSRIPDTQRHFIDSFARAGETVSGILFASRSPEGTRIHTHSAASAGLTVILFAVALRMWGTLLNVDDQLTSIASLLDRLAETLGSETTIDGSRVVSSMQGLTDLPVDEDVRVVGREDGDSLGDVVRELSDSIESSARSMTRSLDMLYRISPPGSDLSTSLSRLKHPGMHTHALRRQAIISVAEGRSLSVAVGSDGEGAKEKRKA